MQPAIENEPARIDKNYTPVQIKKIVTVTTLIIVILWGGSCLLLYQVFPDLKASGLFGDTFGAIHSLFSALALAGVILAIFLGEMFAKKITQEPGTGAPEREFKFYPGRNQGPERSV